VPLLVRPGVTELGRGAVKPVAQHEDGNDKES